MKIRQYELWDSNDNSRLICWLDDDPRLLKKLVRVTLKGIPGRDWFVVKAYKTVKDDADLNRRWKVGGLS